MKQDADFVHDVVERVRARHPGMTEQEALDLEREIRQAWGGERVFVAKDMRRRHHVRAAIVADGLTSAPTEQILTKHGISRSTLYRLMKRLDKGSG